MPMGKQVNFYMLEEDEQEFMEFVLSDHKTVILGSSSLQETPSILDHLPVENSPLNWRGEAFFWRPDYPLFTRYIVMKVGPLQGQGVYFVDGSRSSVIEFDRNFLLPDENMLTRGRIWADMRRLEEDHFIYKGEEFEAWYDSIAKWLRKRYRKVEPGSYFRISPRAYAWYQAGGKLQP
jgi:hypothetical protein